MWRTVHAIVLPDTWFWSKLHENCVAIRRAIQRTTNDAINHRTLGDVVKDAPVRTWAQSAAEELWTACEHKQSAAHRSML